MIERGEIYWIDLGEPRGSGRPAKRRPVLIIQANAYNASRIATTLAVVITSNTNLAAIPGNVFLPTVLTGLPRDSVANVSAVVTINKSDLGRPSGHVPDHVMGDVDAGLRQVLSL